MSGIDDLLWNVSDDLNVVCPCPKCNSSWTHGTLIRHEMGFAEADFMAFGCMECGHMWRLYEDENAQLR